MLLAGRDLISSMRSSNSIYSSSISGKGALISEAKAILRELDHGLEPIAVKRMVLHDNLLGRQTLRAREAVWDLLHLRYVGGRSQEFVTALARMVTHSPNEAAANLVLFYELCQVDPLLYDLTTGCTYELYHSARTTIDKVDVEQWLVAQEPSHPEIAAWSPQTRGKVISSYLAIIRDFGLVRGVQQKSFHKLFMPSEAFLYVLYHHKDRGLPVKAIIQSRDWRLFLMTEDEVVFLMEEAARDGFVRFRHSGDIYDLGFVYSNLREVVDAIVGRKVR